MRSRVVPVRFTPEEHQGLSEAASHLGISLSQLIRHRANAIARVGSGAAVSPPVTSCDTGACTAEQRALELRFEEFVTRVDEKLRELAQHASTHAEITKATSQLAAAVRDQKRATELFAMTLASRDSTALQNSRNRSRSTPNAAVAAGRETRGVSTPSRPRDTRRTSRDTKAGKRCRTR